MEISPSYPFGDFRPLPFLRNGHLQTLLGHWLPGPQVKLPTQVQLVRLPDGDAVALHDTTPQGWQPGDRIAVLVHGLTGSHLSRGVQRLALLLLRHGVRTVRVDLRGAGITLPLSRRTYNGSDSADLRAAVLEIQRQNPHSPLLVVGNSLGGNITLKMAGELADETPSQLRCLAVVSPPIDLGLCCALMSLPRNRIYEGFYLRALISEARQRQRHFPDLPPLSFPQRMTMRLFDDLYTAPRCGFEDALDYYRRGSSAPLIGRIRVPTLILTARDDPFIAVEPFEQLAPSPTVTLRIVPHGGHLGFLGWGGSGGLRWADRSVVSWMLERSR
jgi:predicted alpha/beta-fold hydrolase